MNQTSAHSRWKRLLVMSQLIAAPLLGCNASPVPEIAQALPDATTLAEDSAYMDKLFEKVPAVDGTQAIAVDMADERQYQIMVRRVLASGRTPENSPGLFDSLQRSRERALAAKQGGVSAQNLTQANACGHFLTVNEADSNGTTTWSGKVVLSCQPGVDFVWSDLTVYETDLAQQVLNNKGSTSGSAYAPIRILDSIRLSHSLPSTDNSKVIFFDSSAVADDFDTGASFNYFLRTKMSTIGTPPSLLVSHPSNRIGGDAVTRTCLERGNFSGTHVDCDYATVFRDSTGAFQLWRSGQTPVGVAAARTGTTTWQAEPGLVWLTPTGVPYDRSRLYSALRGAFGAGTVGATNCTITGYEANLTTASLILLDRGGYCTAGRSPGTVVGQMDLRSSLPTGVNVANFNTLANYGTDCLGYEQNVRLLVSVAARARCDGSTNEYLRYRTVEVQPLDFRNSCFGEGTMVTLANGKRVAIEKVKLGDKVVANESGQVLTVTTLARGGESQPMVRLKDDKGHEALVTAKHPVVLASGKVVAADSLKLKDQVKTDKGVATLTSVGRELYERDVFNVALGTEEELAKAGKNGSTLFANGFLMGDSQMQLELSNEQPKPADVIASLPAKWHKDYQTHLALQAKK
jgi:hypothetical protein